ncbi:sialin-like isoform X1 [Haliotis rufescens]|uniref:sialin-like isoform X1 n=1 Tax=Haliotis rufescens TaxID=6454 RepID=UPI00201F3D88|nr:sialin-like isoform X1 [Haliotis rufescens]
MEEERRPLLQRQVSSDDKESGSLLCRGVAARHALAMWSFLGFINLFAIRVNLSVALVAMVNASSDLGQNISVDDECPGDSYRNTSNIPESERGEFQWNEQTQGYVLGAFYYGYCITQLPGGWLAGKVGGKLLFGAGILVPSLLSLLIPMAVRFHISWLITIRVVQGIFQGVVYPAMHSLWGKWAPVMERSKLITVTYAGAQIGTVVAMLGTGYLCKYGFAGGWPSVFYVFGGMGCLWSIMWFIFVHDTPTQHPRIALSERIYIEASIGKKHGQLSPPWRQIFTSRAVWAIVAAHVAQDWGSFTIMTCLPQYMKQVLRFNIEQNGLLSSLPYITLWFINTICGHIADVIRRKGLLSTQNTRKLMNSIGLLIPAGVMVGIGFSGCHPMLAVSLLCLGVGFTGFTMAGYSVNHLDIAPHFAGVLMGITNCFGTTTGFIGPSVVGALTNNNPTASQWRIVFFITAALFLIGGVLFAMFARGEEQKWSIVATLPVRLPRVLNLQEEEDRDSGIEESMDKGGAVY